MGYSRKEEIARMKRERREAKAAKKRQENVTSALPVSNRRYSEDQLPASYATA